MPPADGALPRLKLLHAELRNICRKLTDRKDIWLHFLSNRLAWQTNDWCRWKVLFPTVVCDSNVTQVHKYYKKYDIYLVGVCEKSAFLIKYSVAPWIFAQKWCKQNMFLEKIYFALWMYTKAGEKEYLKSYIGLSSCHLTSTGWPAHLAGINGAV